MADKDRKPDFSGYATKFEVVCTDGRTIKKGAFKHNDGQRVPLVWSHLHDDVKNVLGFAILHDRDLGTYADCYVNNTPSGQQAKLVVEHGDIVALSIFANQLVEKNKIVHEGNIREVSLVMAGANPGAFIDNISFQHSDGSKYESEDEAIISMMSPLDIEEKTEDTIEHVDPPVKAEGKTLNDVIESMTEEQKSVTFALIAKAMDEGNNDELEQSDKEGEPTTMKQNVFDATNDDGPHLTHAQFEEFSDKVFADFKQNGSFKEAFLKHAGTYGIDNISYLFPDAKPLDSEPTFDTRRMSWVRGWMSGTRHTPFSRIKKLWADLTADAARAKGYITGAQKVEQVFPILKRTTEPTTVYKKQKLDRDDISDITDFNVVNWMWREMRFMLDEEVARAALVGDGRIFGVNPDAIDPSKIRPIYGDDPIFVHYLSLAVGVVDYLDIIEAIQVARVNYKGTGTPNFYTTNTVLTGMLLLKDTTHRRIYKSIAELAADLRVADIVEVEALEGIQRTNVAPAFTANLLGIMVNPYDYTYGADKGGQVATFEDFDIDYNQNKYLIETRLSGSLLEPKSAIAVERKTA